MTLSTLLRDARRACLPLEPAERKEFVEAVDWFDRAAARKKQAVKSDTEILVAEI